MATSIFAYKIVSSSSNLATIIYNAISSLPDDDSTYFNLQLISDSELTGEYVTVRVVNEMFYNANDRIFEQRTATKAIVVNFNICNNYLEVWGNKSNAKRLVFALSTAMNNKIAINSIEISIEKILDRIKSYDIKIPKVSFDDFLFTEDIVGNFTVDLSTYSNAYAILEKYKDKIANITIDILCNENNLKINITSKGTLMVYKPRCCFEDDILNILHTILLK